VSRSSFARRFDTGEATLRPDARRALEEVGTQIA
jgi:hypothetical protein